MVASKRSAAGRRAAEDAPPQDAAAKPATVLVAAASTEGRRVGDHLRSEGYRILSVDDGQGALDTLAREEVDVAVLELDLPRVSGLNVLGAGPALSTDARFVLAGRGGGTAVAVEAMKAGAFDYFERPVDLDRLVRIVGCAVEEVARIRESRRATPTGGSGLSSMVGLTPEMQQVFRLIERVAPTRANVLITGETGTGKDLVAKAVHDLSPRGGGPFIAVNCSAIPSTLLEAELFGHTRGSFTGAVQSRKGLIEDADGGTLFLDEISTLSEDVQVKLLRVLQDHRVQRIGSGTSVPVDFRLVAATNTDLAVLVRSGDFREDLYFRLDVFQISVPPLRQRTGDVVPLAEHFLLRFGEEHGVEPPTLTPATLSRMLAYEWPGNVRELENFIERSVILYPGARGFPFDLPRGAQAREERTLVDQGAEQQWPLERLEREYLLATLERTRWRQAAAAEILGINRRTIHRKLKRYRDEGLLPDVEIE